VAIKKLLIKAHHAVRVVNAPDPYGGLQTEHLEPANALLLFVNNRAELEQHLDAAIGGVESDGLLWIAYRKGGVKAGTDLNRDLLWAAVGPRGWTGVSLISLDDTWSAMRFRPTAKVGT
jgi:hypothetical protein